MNQLLEIGRHLFVLGCFLIFLPASSSTFQSDLDSISSLLRSRDFQEAKSFTIQAKAKNDGKGNAHWLTRSNLLLGYIYTVEDDYAKAIIHYLEGIRYSKNASYDEVESNLASLYYRCGDIFRRFKAYQLAEEYFFKGLEYADEDMDLIIKYNIAALYKDKGDYNLAIDLLSENIEKLDVGSRNYFNFNNRLALTLTEAKEFQKSIQVRKRVIEEISEDNIHEKGKYHHNLAKTYRLSGNYELALESYSKAIEYKGLKKVKKSLFSSYFGIAETYFELGGYKSAEEYFAKAEELIDLQPTHPDYFEIYKKCADLNYTLGKYEKTKHYEDLYTANMNDYVSLQSEVQNTDQRYNMDLITKRYFAEVDKQERIASILMYSKITSGSLLALLFIVIGYHRYQKIRLRKSIERELIALKIIE